MNEEYAADPGACETGLEFAGFLKEFGPYSGRYLVKFPSKWLRLVHARVESLPDGLHKSRAKRALEKLKSQGGLLPPRGRNWIDTLTWLENADQIQGGPARFANIVVQRPDAGKYPCIDDFEPAPSNDAFVSGTAKELAAAAEKLLLLGPCAHLIDPYFNPCFSSNLNVLRELLMIAKGGATWKFEIWSLADKVLERNTKDELQAALKEVAFSAGFFGREIRLLLVHDKTLKVEDEAIHFHTRYLLTKLGALRYDTGFQEVPKGKKVEVSVVGQRSHEQLIRVFMESGLESCVRHVVTAVV